MKVIILLSFLISFSIFADSRTLCGPTDDRDLSYNSKVGRGISTLNAYDACTFTLVSKSCAISAGHCGARGSIVEFNTPLSKDGKITHPDYKDMYRLYKTVGYQNVTIGLDWMVIKIQKNKTTGLYPGEVYGYYNISLDEPVPGSEIIIYGYGADNEAEKNYTQQVSKGPYLGLGLYNDSAEHRVDTMSGNSGSAMILTETDEIIGVHTHGGCINKDNFPKSSNSGTLISKNKKFRDSLLKCIKSDL